MNRNFQVSVHHGENQTIFIIADDELDLSTNVDDKELAEHIAHLLNMEQAEICPQCSGVSAYCWDDVSEDAYEDDSLPYNPKQGTIAHIPTAGCWEWQCGHCQAHLIEKDSPINHPCYTHEED